MSVIEKTINDYAEREGKTYATTSIRNFTNQLTKLNNGNIPTKFNYLKNTEKIKSIIDNYKKKNGEPFSLNTKKSYYITIATILRAVGDSVSLKIYNKIIENYNNENNQIKDEKVLTKAEKENWVNFKTLETIIPYYKKLIEDKKIIQRVDELKKAEFLLLQKYIIACLYILIPPKRADYIMKIIYDIKDNDEQQNYLLVKSSSEKYFIFNKYKTSKTYKSQQEKVNDKLNTVLNLWLKYNDKGHLLYNTDLNPVNENSLVKLIPIVFNPLNKHITINLLRKIFISYSVDENDYKKVDEMAKKMMHSSNTAYKSYFKIIE